VTAITGDLAVKDGQARLQLGHMSPDMLAMPDQELFPFGLARHPLRPQRGIPNHIADRHAGCSQTAQELDPGQDRAVIFPLLGRSTRCPRQQTDPLVIAERMGRQPGASGKVADLHALPCLVMTPQVLQL